MNAPSTNKKAALANILYGLVALWCSYLMIRLLVAQWWRIELDGMLGAYSIAATWLYAVPALIIWGVARFLGGKVVYGRLSLLLILLIYLGGLLVPSGF